MLLLQRFDSPASFRGAFVPRVKPSAEYGREREGRPKRESLYLNAEIESARAHGIRDGITGAISAYALCIGCNPCPSLPGPDPVP